MRLRPAKARPSTAFHNRIPTRRSCQNVSALLRLRGGWRSEVPTQDSGLDMPVMGGIADMVHSGHFTLLRTAVSRGLGGNDACLVGRRWAMGMRRRRRRRRRRREMLMERVMVEKNPWAVPVGCSVFLSRPSVLRFKQTT